MNADLEIAFQGARPSLPSIKATYCAYTHVLIAVRHIGPRHWCIQHDDGQEYDLVLGFEQTPNAIVEEFAMNDLEIDWDPSLSPNHAKRALFRFLGQFEELEHRWRNMFEIGTCEIIAQCARYQKDILIQRSPMSDKTFEDSILLVQLLRCWLVSSDLSEVDGNYGRSRFTRDDDTYDVRPEGVDDYYGLEASITIRRHARYRSLRSPHQGILPLLKKAISNTQRIMFRRQPKDLPAGIYSLCILAMIVKNFNPMGDFLNSVESIGEELDDIYHTLCDLYIFCSGNVHPFTDQIDMMTYTSAVNNDPVAISHFKWLHEKWKEAGKLNTQPYAKSGV